MCLLWTFGKKEMEEARAFNDIEHFDQAIKFLFVYLCKLGTVFRGVHTLSRWILSIGYLFSRKMVVLLLSAQFWSACLYNSSEQLAFSRII